MEPLLRQHFCFRDYRAPSPCLTRERGRIQCSKQLSQVHRNRERSFHLRPGAVRPLPPPILLLETFTLVHFFQQKLSSRLRCGGALHAATSTFRTEENRGSALSRVISPSHKVFYIVLYLTIHTRAFAPLSDLNPSDSFHQADKMKGSFS